MSDKSVKNSKIINGPTLSTQTYLRISEIREKTLVLKNGGIRGVLRVSSINFNLKSEDEQNAIIYSYQGFLNTLEDPIQIVIRSKKLDIDNYIYSLKEKANKQSNALLQKQTNDYIEYIQKLVEYTDIMEKEFYVIIPQDPYNIEKSSFLARWFRFINSKDTYVSIKEHRKQFDELKKKLSQKVNSVRIGLESCGLQVEELSTKELIELFYQNYNPNISRFQKGDTLDKTNIQSDDIRAAEDKGNITVENKTEASITQQPLST